MDFYCNTDNIGRFQYARPYTTDLSKQLNFTDDGGLSHINVNVTGIPDGISPLANEATTPIINSQHLKRLYVFSDTQLDDSILSKIDNLYGKNHYPIITAQIPYGRKPLGVYPNTNFYLCHGPPTVVSNFTEYRYVQQRHVPANCALDISTGDLYRLTLPHKVLIVIVMPENFVQTGRRSGYFRFDNNLIVQVISKYPMASSNFSPIEQQRDIVPYPEVSQISTYDDRLRTMIEQFFTRMGMHKIVLSSESNNQIYAYDKYMTLVAGIVDNILFAV